MARITVEHAGGDEYAVEVDENGSSTRHRVSVPEAEREHLAAGATPEELVEESFRFLLEREPKEAILRTFEISLIGRYFPEYPREIGRRLGGSGHA